MAESSQQKYNPISHSPWPTLQKLSRIHRSILLDRLPKNGLVVRACKRVDEIERDTMVSTRMSAPALWLVQCDDSRLLLRKKRDTTERARWKLTAPDALSRQHYPTLATRYPNSSLFPSARGWTEWIPR